MQIKFFRFLALLVISIGSLFLLVSHSSNDFIKEIVSKMLFLEKRFPIEKSYLHFDKELYSLGEKIWYKAYLTRDVEEKPSNLSKVLYVDILSPDNTLIEQQRIKLDEGMGKGSFHLDGKDGSGFYKIKAYTNWNRNFDNEYFFSREIPVYDFRKEIDKGYTFNWTESEEGYDLTLQLNNKVFFDKIPENRRLKALLIFDSAEYKQVVQIPTNNSVKVSFPGIRKSDINKTQANIELRIFDEDWIETEKRLAIKTPFDNIKADFFPEGGELVVGVRSKVALKITDSRGNYLNASGEIFKTDGTQITTFETVHDGMGFFYLIPEKNEQYFAKVIVNEEVYKVDMPHVSNNKLGISVHDKGSNIMVAVQRNTGKAEGSGLITLIGQSGNKVLYAAQGEYPKGNFIANIPKSKFPSGIVQFTLFDIDRKPVAERLFFIDNYDHADAQISTNKMSYGRRERVEVTVHVNDNEGKPVEGKFSASVTDKDQVAYNPETQNILSHLLLSSDLKGDIINPGYYFNRENALRLEHLDLVMLTHGWRRFEWRKVLNEEYPEARYLIEDGLSLYGHLNQIRNNKRAGMGEISLQRFGAVEEIYTTQTGLEGNFILKGMEIQNEEEVALIAKDAHGKNNVIITWDSTYHMEDHGPLLYSADLDENENIKEFMDQSMMRHQINMAYSYEVSDLFLDMVTITGTEITEQEQTEQKFMKIYQKADVTVDIKNMKGIESALSVFDLLLGKVSGLKISGSFANPTIIIRGVGLSQYNSILDTAMEGLENEEVETYNADEPLFVVNGTAVDKELVMSIPVTEIDHVDILKGHSTAMFGARGANGIIAVYTKIDKEKFENKDGVKIIDYNGYSVSREFYSPDYSEKREVHAKPDYRATVHWEPMIETGPDGKATFVFYTTDKITDLNVDIQGVGSEGHKLASDFRITVSGSQ